MDKPKGIGLFAYVKVYLLEERRREHEKNN